MCYKKDIVMILKRFISFISKLFDSRMYSIRTETGNVVFHPETEPYENTATDTRKEKASS